MISALRELDEAAREAQEEPDKFLELTRQSNLLQDKLSVAELVLRVLAEKSDVAANAISKALKASKPEKREEKKAPSPLSSQALYPVVPYQVYGHRYGAGSYAGQALPAFPPGRGEAPLPPMAPRLCVPRACLRCFYCGQADHLVTFYGRPASPKLRADRGLEVEKPGQGAANM